MYDGIVIREHDAVTMVDAAQIHFWVFPVLDSMGRLASCKIYMHHPKSVFSTSTYPGRLGGVSCLFATEVGGTGGVCEGVGEACEWVEAWCWWYWWEGESRSPMGMEESPFKERRGSGSGSLV